MKPLFVLALLASCAQSVGDGLITNHVVSHEILLRPESSASFQGRLAGVLAWKTTIVEWSDGVDAMTLQLESDDPRIGVWVTPILDGRDGVILRERSLGNGASVGVNGTSFLQPLGKTLIVSREDPGCGSSAEFYVTVYSRLPERFAADSEGSLQKASLATDFNLVISAVDELYEVIKDSVADRRSESTPPDYPEVLHVRIPGTEISEGSGVVISRTGLVLTAAHVVAVLGDDGSPEPAQRIELGFPIGYEYNDFLLATTVFIDHELDLALLQIQSDTAGEPLPGYFELEPAILASSDPEPGAKVILSGYPAAQHALAIRVEAVSSIPDLSGDRELEDALLEESLWLDIRHTDEVIEEGSSGGAVFDDRGRLVGIYVGVTTLVDYPHPGTHTYGVYVPVSAIPAAWGLSIAR